MSRNITLQNESRFLEPHPIDRAKLIKAAEKATDKLLERTKRLGFGYPGTCSKDFRYQLTDATNWESGMYTGCFLLAYELTGEKAFKDIALSHLASYERNIDLKENINDHDVGFVYSPSCVAAYKLFGDEKAKEIALRTVEYYYNRSYSKEGRFIIRAAGGWDAGWGCRTMMDALMNAPFLFWAGKETGREEYFKAALQHNLTVEKLLIREDGSSFHHYQFDPKTAAPVRGLTLQGHSDDSCWSRGHAWGVYGFPIAYGYTGNEKLKEVHKDITYYMLNHLPENDIPHWDYIFMDEYLKEDASDPEANLCSIPKDSSAGMISACGLHEMARLLAPDAPEKTIYLNAAAKMLDAVIDMCTGDIGVEYDGLINQVTHALPQGQGIDECAVYGDYFYLEALARFLKPDFKMYW